MKRICILLLVMAMLPGLCACGGKDQEMLSVPDETPVVELKSEDISIDRKDFSILDDDGSVLIRLYYDLVQLPDTLEQYRKINQALQENYESFRTTSEEVRGYVESAGQYVKAYAGDEEIWASYYDTCDASISTHADGLLSIVFETQWFMGGVYNRNVYGLTFDLQTGEAMKPGDLFGADDSVVLEYLKSCIHKYIIENPGEWWLDSVHVCVEDFLLNSNDVTDEMDNWRVLKYFLEDGEVVLCIPTYTLAAGAAGPQIIHTGLYAEQCRPSGQSTIQETLLCDDSEFWYGLYPMGQGAEIFEPRLIVRDDSTCRVTHAYYNSDVILSVEGSYEIDENGVLTIHYQDGSGVDCAYSYQVTPIGAGIQLYQLGEDAFRNGYESGTVLSFFQGF